MTTAVSWARASGGVLKPLRGISGIAAGVSAAIQFLMSRRPNPHNATLDEEMFI